MRGMAPYVIAAALLAVAATAAQAGPGCGVVIDRTACLSAPLQGASQAPASGKAGPGAAGGSMNAGKAGHEAVGTGTMIDLEKKLYDPAFGDSWQSILDVKPPAGKPVPLR